jgi:hypothetical protein
MSRIKFDGFRRHRKVGKTGGEAGKAQDAHRILGEGRPDMAQDSGLQIALTVEGIDQCAVGRPGHGIDGQVAPCEIVIERDIGRRMKAKP